MSKRRRCTFNDDLEKEFKFIKLDKWTAEKLLQEVESVPCSLVGSGEFSQLKNFCDFAGNNYGIMEIQGFCPWAHQLTEF
jgi:hypothetical protein